LPICSVSRNPTSLASKSGSLPASATKSQGKFECTRLWARFFGGGTFREKFLPHAPSSKAFKHFFLCHGMSIVSRHRYCRMQSIATERCDDAKDPDCTPVGARRMRFCFGEELFAKSSSPMPPLQKLSYIFFLCDGVPILSRQRCCRVQSTATERCDDAKDPDCAPVGARDAAFVRKLFEKSFPTPFKNFYAFFPFVMECPSSQGAGTAD